MVKYYAVTSFFGVESDAVIGEEAAKRLMCDKEIPARSYREVDKATYEEIKVRSQFIGSILERTLGGNEALTNFIETFIETRYQHKPRKKFQKR